MMMLIIIGVHKLIFLVGTPIVSSLGTPVELRLNISIKGYVDGWLNNISQGGIL